MTIKRLIAICTIVLCTSVAWFFLGGTVQFRSNVTDVRLGSEVAKIWGPVLTQEHPALFYEAPTSAGARRDRGRPPGSVRPLREGFPPAFLLQPRA